MGKITLAIDRRSDDFFVVVPCFYTIFKHFLHVLYIPGRKMAFYTFLLLPGFTTCTFPTIVSGDQTMRLFWPNGHRSFAVRLLRRRRQFDLQKKKEGTIHQSAQCAFGFPPSPFTSNKAKTKAIAAAITGPPPEPTPIPPSLPVSMAFPLRLSPDSPKSSFNPVFSKDSYPNMAIPFSRRPSKSVFPSSQPQVKPRGIAHT